MTSYCLGFAFTDHDNFVVLIRKNKPAWQKGLLNGVGGKVEETDGSPRYAMVREFAEETGLVTHSDLWVPFTEMRYDGVRVHCFATRLPRENESFSQMTDEQVGLYSIIDVRNHPKIIPNLRWLIPMALHKLNEPESNEVPHTLDHE